ncbi:NCHL1 protein, partial [Atractosteus spatula]|nr:NCHL1 protein [Atractosteus spatula]
CPVEQLPTITEQSPTSQIAFPFDESISIKCEAKGNPEPEFQWTKDGLDFFPDQDSRLITQENSGTFVIVNNGNITEFQGKYRCYASNKLGTAVSEEIEFIVPSIPKFPKEKIDPFIVEEGQSVILKCNPPKGIPPLQIYWMTIGLQHIQQDERVSMGLNGDLFFSNALEKDSRSDYCCVASFPRIRTILQKTAMSLIVNRIRSVNGTESPNAISERKPRLLSPSGGHSEIQLVKGDLLQLECIAEGLPTPSYEWVRVGADMPEQARKENHGKLLRIPNVQEEDDGKYMCKAKNLLGEVHHYFHVTVEEPPQWDFKPESQIKVIGSEAHIRCSATGKPQPSIKWTINGLPLHDVPASNRRVLGDTVILHNVKPNDSAVYQCQASNKHGTILANANIMVMNLPPMILTEDFQEYAAVVGKSVTMHCKVFSSPTSAISWSKDESVDSLQDDKRFAVHKNGSLEIHSVVKKDSGQYICLATNNEGKSAITTLLDVKDATKIVDAPQHLKVLRGTTAQLTCQAEYDSTFKSTFRTLWKKDQEEISFNNTESTRYYEDSGVLQIINVNHEDEAVYTCIAITPLDQDEATAQLIVLGKWNYLVFAQTVDVPDPPVELALSDHKNRSVKLKWDPGDSHNSPITEFIVEYEETRWEPGKWKELVRVPGNHASALLKLHGHLDYQFRVLAVNEVGRGQPSEPTERYKTPPAAPDKNPENIKIEGHLPNELDINWEPLKPIEQNGPGLEYKVSFRQQGSEEDWTDRFIKRHSFVVKNTPTFVAYEIKIQAKNHYGWGPAPQVVTGYSGEDFPSAAPDNVEVKVLNSTLAKVSWSKVPKDKINGHLGGYKVSWWRMRSLLESKKSHGEKHMLTFPGDRHHGMVPGLKPFSEYTLIVTAFNGRGSGPGSLPATFTTPEGVPEKIQIFRGSPQTNSVTLVWAPPLEPNGILTGYLLQYQINQTFLFLFWASVNDTDDLGNLYIVNITSPTTSKWVVQDLQTHSKYKFYLSACTRAGCGKTVTEETVTFMETLLLSSEMSYQIKKDTGFTDLSPFNTYICVFILNREYNYELSSRTQQSRPSVLPVCRKQVLLFNLHLNHGDFKRSETLFKLCFVIGSCVSELGQPTTLSSPSTALSPVANVTLSSIGIKYIPKFYLPITVMQHFHQFLCQKQTTIKMIEHTHTVNVFKSFTPSAGCAKRVRLHFTTCTSLRAQAVTVRLHSLWYHMYVRSVGYTYSINFSFVTYSLVTSILNLCLPALFNISSSVNDTYAKISWISGNEQKDSEFYVAYINNRKGNWKISEAVNASKNFHIIEGLEPGSEYTVRLLTKNWVDNASIFEDVIETRGKGEKNNCRILYSTGFAGIYERISTQGWFIGLMCAVALLTLIMLIACFVKRNKGGKYSVKEKEDLHPDIESQVMNDDTFCEYSDNDEKPLKGSLQSLNGNIKAADSGDSLVDYGEDEPGQFNEDGSFIGEYAGRKDRGSMEVKGTNQIQA